MAHFYRKLLEESEQNHEAAVAATQNRVIGPHPNLTITRPPELMPRSDLELAELARQEGKEVELNDDNQIVDKRELLAAGLNLSGVNTRKLSRTGGSNAAKDNEQMQAHRAVGTAASRKEINERRAREIQQQMAEEEERVSREKQQAEHEAQQRIVAKRNNEEDVSSARERYLQRKRQKLAQQDQDSEAISTV